MNPGLVVKLRPSGPWRIGPDSGARNRVDVIYHSDSLYSAVTAAMSRLGWLEEWLDATARTGSPAVSFSSCFPYLGEIAFVVPPRSVWPPASQSTKAARIRWKSARFVPLTVVQSILSGQRLDDNQWTVDGPSDCLVPTGKPGPFRTAVRSSAGVDRLTGASERHSTACIEFRPGSGLWTVVSFADESAQEHWSGKVKGAFRLLADTGFGGERSRGWGRSDAPEFIDGMLPDLILPLPTKHAGAAVEPAEGAEAAVIAVRPIASATVVPAGSTILPTDSVPLPTDATIVPVDASILRSDAAIVPVDATTSPIDAAIVPVDATTSPTDAAIVPVDATTSPIDATLLPTDATILPTDSTNLPTDPTILPPDSTNLPTAPTILPTDATILPTDATILPTDPTVLPTAPTVLPSRDREGAVPDLQTRTTESAAETEIQPEPTTISPADAIAPATPAIEIPAAESMSTTASASDSHAATAPATEPTVTALATPATEIPEPEPLAVAAAAASDATVEVPAPEPQLAGAPTHPHWLLSLFTPASADSVDWRRGNYTVMPRGGRVDSPAGSGELKKQIQMVAEGSVLYAETAPRGSAADVAPDGFAHPVFRAGFAVAIPLPEVR